MISPTYASGCLSQVNTRNLLVPCMVKVAVTSWPSFPRSLDMQSHKLFKNVQHMSCLGFQEGGEPHYLFCNPQINLSLYVFQSCPYAHMHICLHKLVQLLVYWYWFMSLISYVFIYFGESKMVLTAPDGFTRYTASTLVLLKWFDWLGDHPVSWAWKRPTHVN